ncbi:sensor histidine kinase [Frankia tisae]|uniref:sensor histidine kinase n=1 Tax=Frankia tisae TaxID=2950104 RepID=UPI0021C09BB4|nr:histidine kinase [Frankia tisae]
MPERMADTGAGGTSAPGVLRRWLLQPALPHPVLPDQRSRVGMDPWRWRRVASVFLIYLGYAVSDMFALHDGVGVIVFGFGVLVAFSLLYLWAIPLIAFHGRRELRVPVLVAMAACIAAYLPLVGGGGLVMTTYLAVALVLLLRPIVSLPLILAIAAVDTWLPERIGWWQTHGEQWSLSGPVLFVALTMFGIRAGARNQVELSRAHREIERLAKEQERLRIARDLHDLLGHALTTITVKAELASKLAGRDPARAAVEMAEVAALGRQSLADVRATVAGYREVSLVTELAAARQVLAAAGIRAELPGSVDGVPGALRELFGWVLREGVVNAVRHSGASHLRVTVDERGIEVVDDGTGPRWSSTPGSSSPGVGPHGAAPNDGGGRGGAGLAGLSERVAAFDGRLEAGPATVGAETPGFRLRVVVPPQTPTPASASPPAPAARTLLPAAGMDGAQTGPGETPR